MDKLIINKLLDIYENSAHAMDRESNRRVMINPCQLDGYDCTDYEYIKLLNEALEKLSDIVLCEYDKRRNRLISRIILPTDKITQAYEYVGRTDIKANSRNISSVLQKTADTVDTEWIKTFLKTELSNLEKKRRTSAILESSVMLTENICKVLECIDKDEYLMRTLSVKCFNDSKYFEKHLKNKLVSIAKRYEPEIVSTASDEDLADKEILNQIGIITAPEIFEFCGGCSFEIENNNIDISLFKKGYCINSESADMVSGFHLDGIRRILFVENRTNYRQLVADGVEPDTFLIFHGGFYSPARGRLFKRIYSAANSNTEFLFWGDIDLGGFLMFERLRRHIIPTLMPYKMDCETFMSVVDNGVRNHSEKYFEKLQQYECAYEFEDVKRLILEYKMTIEQESMIL